MAKSQYGREYDQAQQKLIAADAKLKKITAEAEAAVKAAKAEHTAAHWAARAIRDRIDGERRDAAEAAQRTDRAKAIAKSNASKLAEVDEALDELQSALAATIDASPQATTYHLTAKIDGLQKVRRQLAPVPA